MCRCETAQGGCEAVGRALREHLSATDPLRPEYVSSVLLIFFTGVFVGAALVCVLGAACRLWVPLKRAVAASRPVPEPRPSPAEGAVSDGSRTPGRRRGVLLAAGAAGLREV